MNRALAVLVRAAPYSRDMRRRQNDRRCRAEAAASTIAAYTHRLGCLMFPRTLSLCTATLWTSLQLARELRVKVAQRAYHTHPLKKGLPAHHLSLTVSSWIMSVSVLAGRPGFGVHVRKCAGAQYQVLRITAHIAPHQVHEILAVQCPTTAPDGPLGRITSPQTPLNGCLASRLVFIINRPRRPPSRQASYKPSKSCR